MNARDFGQGGTRILTRFPSSRATKPGIEQARQFTSQVQANGPHNRNNPSYATAANLPMHQLPKSGGVVSPPTENQPSVSKLPSNELAENATASRFDFMDKTQPSAELTIRLVDDNAGFLAMESAWNRLSGNVPFRSFQWYRTWWQHFKADHRLLVLAVYDAETCVGIAPLFVERILSLGRVAQFLGSGLVASDQQTILALPPYANAIGRAISDWFASDQNTLADLLQLDGIANDCPAFNAFGIAAQQAGYSFIESSTIHTWRIELPSTTDDYLAGLSKSCRRKIRSALKKFESSELTVSIADSPSSFETSWDCFVGLHQRRRISLGEEGLFRDPVFHHFLYDISKSSFHAGGLDLVTVSSADGPIATELCFRSDTGSYAYQLGVNPDCLKQNPGWLINAASIRHAINLGLSHFDLCRGDFDYKRQMGARATVCKRIRITPPRLRSQVLNAFITNGTAVRNWYLNNLHTTPLQT